MSLISLIKRAGSIISWLSKFGGWTRDPGVPDTKSLLFVLKHLLKAKGLAYLFSPISIREIELFMFQIVINQEAIFNHL